LKALEYVDAAKEAADIRQRRVMSKDTPLRGGSLLAAF